MKKIKLIEQLKRNAKYEFKNPGNLSPEEIPMEMVSGVMSSRAKK